MKININKAVIAGALIALSLFLLWSRFSFSTVPLDRDEGAYAYTAWRMTQGDLPYRDVFDHKPPLIYFIYMAAIKTTGGSVQGIRVFTAVWVLLTLFAVYAAGAALFGSTGGLAAAFFFSLFQASVPLQAVNSNTEVFFGLPLMLGILMLALKPRPVIFSAASGFFFGAAIMIKSMVLFVPAAGLIYLFMIKADKKEYIAFTAGCAAVPAAVIAWAAASGILQDFIRDFAAYNVSYVYEYLKIKGSRGPWVSFSSFVKECWPAAAAILYGVFQAVRGKLKPEAALAVSAFSGAAAGIALLKGIYPHYYAGLISLAALCAAFLLMELKKVKYGILTSAAVAVLAVVSSFAANSRYYAVDSKDVSFLQFGSPVFAESEIAAHFINERKKTGATLLAWRANPELYYLTRIKVQGRFPYVLDIAQKLDYERAGEFLDFNLKNTPDFLALDDSDTSGRIYEAIGSEYILALKMRAMELYVKRGK